MIKPRKHKDHKALLTAELVAEHNELSRIAPTFGRTALDGYTERAKKYNEKCRELGATLMMVVES